MSICIIENWSTEVNLFNCLLNPRTKTLKDHTKNSPTPKLHLLKTTSTLSRLHPGYQSNEPIILMGSTFSHGLFDGGAVLQRLSIGHQWCVGICLLSTWVVSFLKSCQPVKSFRNGRGGSVSVVEEMPNRQIWSGGGFGAKTFLWYPLLV